MCRIFEWAGLNLRPHGQVGWLDKSLEEVGLWKPEGFATLGGNVKAIPAGLLAATHQPENVFCHDRQPLRNGLWVFLQVRADKPGLIKMSGPHKGRINRHDHQGFPPGGFDQAFDYAEGWLKEIFPDYWNVHPIFRFTDGRMGWLGLFVLDFDEIHASMVEEFQVFVNGSLVLVVGSIEMHEKSGWYGF